MRITKWNSLLWLIGLVGMLAHKIQAQPITETWASNTYGTWNTASDWTPAGVPNEIGSDSQYIASISSGGITLGNDIQLTGLDWGGGSISGLYNITVESNLVLYGADRSLSINQLILAPGSTAQWTAGNNVWGSSQIINSGTFTVADSGNVQFDTNAAGSSTFGGMFNNTVSGTINKTGIGSLSFGSSFANAGTFNISSGNVTFNGPVNNSGTFQQAGGTTTFNGQFIQTAGSYYVQSNAVLAGNATFQGGRLGGTGVINNHGNLYITNGAVLDPGNGIGQAGRLTISNAVFLNGGILQADIGGTNAGLTYDQVVARNYPSLSGGTLDISLINGYTPATNNAFTILLTSDGTPLSGSFLDVTNGGRLETSDDSGSFLVSYGTGANSSDVLLSDFDANSVPEPNPVALLSAAFLGLVFLKRWLH